jgi:hypothetical protein
MSELESLYKKAKEVVYFDPYEDEVNLKFSFAFALTKICDECHGGQSSYLYALSSALFSEWKFNCGMDYYDSDDSEQRECFEFLIKELGVIHLYNDDNNDN